MNINIYCPELGGALEESAVRCLDSLLIKAGGSLLTVIMTVLIGIRNT